MAQARPQGGGGMSQSILYFLAGQGFKQFVDSMHKMKGGGDKGKGKAGGGGAEGLVQSLMASRAMPQAGVSPPSGATPALLQGGNQPNFLAMLAMLANKSKGMGTP